MKRNNRPNIDNEGPVQARRLLEESMELREHPMKTVIVGGGRSFGRTFLTKALLEASLITDVVVIEPTENIKRPANERVCTSPKKPFYIPTPKPTRSYDE